MSSIVQSYVIQGKASLHVTITANITLQIEEAINQSGSRGLDLEVGCIQSFEVSGTWLLDARLASLSNFFTTAIACLIGWAKTIVIEIEMNVVATVTEYRICNVNSIWYFFSLLRINDK